MQNHLDVGDATAAQGDLSRRDFVAVSLAAGLPTLGDQAVAADLAVVETDVSITTSDGMCDAAFIHPSTAAHAGVLIWPDAFGLRPAMRQMGRRLAAQGYAVLVPNPFYRMAKAPVFETAANFNFRDKAAFDKLRPLMGSVNAPGAAEKDAAAFIAFLDAQPQIDTSKKIGTQGYCMGGALVVRTAAAAPDRIGAGASSMVAGWSATSPTARTCWHRRSRRACTSAWRPTTTSSSPTPRTS